MLARAFGWHGQATSARVDLRDTAALHWPTLLASGTPIIIVAGAVLVGDVHFFELAIDHVAMNQ